MHLGWWSNQYGSKEQMTIMLHNYMSTQFPRTLNREKFSIQLFQRYASCSMGKPIWVKWACDHNAAQLQVLPIPKKICVAVTDICILQSLGPRWYLIWKFFGPWASPYVSNGQMTMMLHNCRSKQFHRILNDINLSSSLRDMRSGLWASPYGSNGKWPWCCATEGVDNSTEIPEPYNNTCSAWRAGKVKNCCKNVPQKLQDSWDSFEQTHVPVQDCCISIANVLEIF